VPGDLALPVAVEGMLFRIAQEALRNVMAHAQASTVTVTVASDARVATVAVVDDGRGFDPAAVGEQSFGLRLLGDLLRDVGGSLAVESEPGGGTTVTAEVPLP
jgi:signal transduction histidine kinase